MKLPWKSGEKADPTIDVEFERSVADEPKREEDRDPLDRERHYGGEPLLDRPTEVDPEGEAAEWERRYGSEESRNKLGFDGE
jgi:hypothetical protein